MLTENAHLMMSYTQYLTSRLVINHIFFMCLDKFTMFLSYSYASANTNANKGAEQKVTRI